MLTWLKEKYEEDVQGFWINESVIRASLGYELWVFREHDKVVAFQVGNYSPDIVNVKKDKQKLGLGTALVEAFVARAIADDVNVLLGECNPETSLPFWQKHGFKQYNDPLRLGKILVRRVLHRDLPFPGDLALVEVSIGFYPEAELYGAAEPLSVHNVNG